MWHMFQSSWSLLFGLRIFSTSSHIYIETKAEFLPNAKIAPQIFEYIIHFVNAFKSVFDLINYIL